MSKSATPRVAYFCMEFGLDERFKIYSGGLGILAGDVLKAAQDGHYPLIGIGILWRQGYTTQIIRNDGQLYDCYPEYHYDFLKDTGVTVSLTIRGRQVHCKVWECTHFNNVPLYLLDANLPENDDRLLTGQLYGWFSEERIAQEMILGIGGVRALKALGIEVDLYHFNDSHPVVAGLELIRKKMAEEGMSFEHAWDQTRRQVVFTTHTPVLAGNEVHEIELLKYMGADQGLTYGQLTKLGGDPFSMTVAGLRLAKKANAVAQLHCQTARQMWRDVTKAAEIIGITNGVHTGTWQDARIRQAFQTQGNLWDIHQLAKDELLNEIDARNHVKLKKDILTIGFARRMADYKRGDLIFTKPEVIFPLLEQGRLQLIFSGKAHPNDLDGKALIERLYHISQRYPENVVFLQNYDMRIGKLLTRGCDVWLNNPLRPMEASGTSGMKAAMNGVLNCSILDGWWPEGCVHGVTGWKIGDDAPSATDDLNERDAESLYQVLVDEILPAYYNRPQTWREMMRSSIEMSQWRFSAARMLQEYYQLLYQESVSPSETATG